MRIVSGIYKGRSIHPPKTFKARPTTDFAKESLFNIISNNFNFGELTVLDLFSGTGSISYEFASRGCLKGLAVEIDFRNYNFIKQTLEVLNFNQIKIIRTNVFVALRKIQEKFDIIFADPPYDLDHIDEIPKIIFQKNILTQNGWFILEHGKDNDFSSYQYFKEIRQYGSVHFSIFSNK